MCLVYCLKGSSIQKQGGWFGNLTCQQCFGIALMDSFNTYVSKTDTFATTLQTPINYYCLFTTVFRSDYITTPYHERHPVTFYIYLSVVLGRSKKIRERCMFELNSIQNT